MVSSFKLTDKLKSREIFVCPVKLSFSLCKSQFERNIKVVCVSREKTWINNDIFSMLLGIVGDFVSH